MFLENRQVRCNGRTSILQTTNFAYERFLLLSKATELSHKRGCLRRQNAEVHVHIIKSFLIDSIKRLFCLLHLIVDELPCRLCIGDRVLSLLADVLTSQLGCHRLSSLWNATLEGNVEAISDVVAASVYFNLDVFAYSCDDRFYRLATQTLSLVELVSINKWLERTSTGNDLRNAC